MPVEDVVHLAARNVFFAAGLDVRQLAARAFDRSAAELLDGVGASDLITPPNQVGGAENDALTALGNHDFAEDALARLRGVLLFEKLRRRAYRFPQCGGVRRGGRD